MASLQALRDRAPESLSEGMLGRIDESGDVLILRPGGEKFVAAVIETPVLGENADCDRKAAKDAGEAERRGGLKIRTRADRPLCSQSAAHLPHAGNAGRFAQRVLRTHEGLDDKPFPDQPGWGDLVRGDYVGVPTLADAGACGHGGHKPRIAHADRDGRQQTIGQPFVSGLQPQRVDTAFPLLGGIEFRTERRSQHERLVG
jgi:hypothetical protein